jgi:hypothetical protein
MTEIPWISTKMYVKETECEGVDWIQLAQKRVYLTDSCEHGNKPWGSMKSGTFFDRLSNYRLVKKDVVLYHGASHLATKY